MFYVCRHIGEGEGRGVSAWTLGLDGILAKRTCRYASIMLPTLGIDAGVVYRDYILVVVRVLFFVVEQTPKAPT